MSPQPATASPGPTGGDHSNGHPGKEHGSLITTEIFTSIPPAPKCKWPWVILAHFKAPEVTDIAHPGPWPPHW